MDGRRVIAKTSDGESHRRNDYATRDKYANVLLSFKWRKCAKYSLQVDERVHSFSVPTIAVYLIIHIIVTWGPSQ